MKRARSLAVASGSLAWLAVATACAVDEPTSARPPERPSLGKAAPGISVTSTDPSYAHRGDAQVSVRVLGSGFTPGAKAQWIFGPDSTSVITDSTTYVSSTELRAVITVSGTAPLALYDIRVMLADGKKGVGAEKFAVTTATVLGVGTLGGDVIVNDVNDQGQVVGYFDQAGPFVYDGNAIVSLGSTGQAWGISPDGQVVVGRDYIALAWIRQGPSVYTREPLPTLLAGGNGGATRTAVSPSGDLLVAGYQNATVNKRTTVNSPVVWSRTGTTWSTPTVYTLPAGADVGSGWRLNGLGQMMGKAGSGWGIWESPSTFVGLNAPWLNGMNKAATVAVGVVSAGAALWYRDVSTQQWNPNPVLLPVPSGCTGSAMDINDDGIIVGYTCGATVWRIDASVSPPAIVSGPTILVGLPGPSGIGGSRADAVTSTYPYVVVGRANSSGRNLLVKWTLP